MAKLSEVETEDGTLQEFKSRWNIRGVDNRSWFVTKDLRLVND